MLLVLDNITKVYKLYEKPIDRLKEALHPQRRLYHKDFFALKDISFSIDRGEVVAIVGKNGSGKSTLLKIITGVLTPISGKCIVNAKITALLELGAGFNPELSGLENLYLSGTIMGYSQREMESKVEEIVAFAEIENFIHQPIKTYSSGMKARLGFALAINVNPEILIVDEVLSVGDVAFSKKCYSKIEHLCKDNNTTVLFVSHSAAVVKQLCSRAIMLHDGQKVIDGKASDVVNLYEKFMSNEKIEIENVQAEFAQIKREKNSPTSTIKKGNFSEAIYSKSKVEYKENGAKISNIQVLDCFGNKSNILNFKEDYIYRYEIEFFDNYENVKVAMFIKSAKGIEILGNGVPLEEQNISEVKSGECYGVEWKFNNIFNEGFYFFNCAVNATSYGVKTILHRVVDAYMIKSQKELENHSKGFVDIGVELNVTRLGS